MISFWVAVRKGNYEALKQHLDNNLNLNTLENEGVLKYYYTYDDTWSVPGQITTLDGAGYYPQATTNFLTGFIFKF